MLAASLFMIWKMVKTEWMYYNPKVNENLGTLTETREVDYFLSGACNTPNLKELSAETFVFSLPKQYDQTSTLH